MKDLAMDVVGFAILGLILSVTAIFGFVVLGSCGYISFKIVQFIFGI